VVIYRCRIDAKPFQASSPFGLIYNRLANQGVLALLRDHLLGCGLARRPKIILASLLDIPPTLSFVRHAEQLIDFSLKSSLSISIHLTTGTRIGSKTKTSGGSLGQVNY